MFLMEKCMFTTDGATDQPTPQPEVPTSDRAGGDTVRTPPHPGLEEARRILSELTPVPKAVTQRQRKRKSETAQIVTSSPFKKLLLQQAEQRQKKTPSKIDKPLKKSKKPTKMKSKQCASLPAATMASDTTPCIMCSVRYCDPPFDDWQQCPKCQGWYHLGCGPDDTALCYKCLP